MTTPSSAAALLSAHPLDDMQIKKRNPFLHWIIIMITFGQYAFIWPFFMARDINRIAKREIIPWKRTASRFAVVYCIYIAGFIALNVIFLTQSLPQHSHPPQWLFWGLFVVAIYLMIMFFKMLFAIRRQLLNLNLTKPPSSAMVIFTSLIYMISVPILQSSLNKVIDAYQDESGNA